MTQAYAFYGQIPGDAEPTLMFKTPQNKRGELSEVEAKRLLRAERDRMKAAYFTVREYRDDVTGLPGFAVINPLTGAQECRYWVGVPGEGI